MTDLLAGLPEITLTPDGKRYVSEGKEYRRVTDIISKVARYGGYRYTWHMNTNGGFCHCGCGESTTIAKRSNAEFGHVKGEPVRFRPGHHRRRNPLTRFWEKVNVQSDDECWEWLGATTGAGYGHFKLRKDGKAWEESAHRFSYEIHNGPIPPGGVICHSCDNPPCVNPGHLFLGTYADNTADMIKKGRANTPTGERSGHAKLTWDDVENIRANATNLTEQELGDLFGVGQPAINGIIGGKTWKEPK